MKKVLGKNVLVLLEQTESKTASGIYIPDNATKQSSRGTVVLIGPEVTDIEIGDTVLLYGPNTGVNISLDGKEHLVVELKNILGVL